MGSFSLVHWLVVILVVTLLFGRGRISDLMGDMAKGINSFKKGLADDGTPPSAYPPAPQGYVPPQNYVPPYVPPHIAPPQPAPVSPVRDDIPRG